MDRVRLGKDVSLSQALMTLSAETKKIIVLIIDEAQHAITTNNGSDTLFALKAARDEINSSRYFGLRIIATGSSQDKLAMLRSSKEQAFYGAPIKTFPHLDIKYVEWFCDNAGLSSRLDPDQVYSLFEKASFRPEVLAAAAESIRLDFFVQDADIAERFREEVEQEIASSHKGALKIIKALTPIQSSVFRVMAASGEGFAPFEAATIKMYNVVLQAIGADGTITADVGNVQQSLAALQDKNLIWRASRGVYALEDSSLVDILDQEEMLNVVPGWIHDDDLEVKGSKPACN
jgi:hypothetical protein